MAKRKRAARGSLTPNKILSAALEIADQEGLAKLTVRKLATQLDVSPMSIYGHFKNKAEIENGLLGCVIDAFAVTRHDKKQGLEWLMESFKRMRRALMAHPGVIPLLGTRASASQESLGVMKDLAGALEHAGLSGEEQVQRIYPMVIFTIGTAHVETGIQRALNKAPLESGTGLVGAVDSDVAQILAPMAKGISKAMSEEQFEKSLRLLCF